MSRKTAKQKKFLKNPVVWMYLTRATMGALLFIIAFNTSSSAFFNDNPIFGVRFLAETLIAIAAGVFGFHTIPLIVVEVRKWVEKYVSDMVSNIVADFWEQQSKRMQIARRNRQKRVAKEKKDKEKLDGATLLDTSVLIDGRIIDVVKTGFVGGLLVIPQCVVDELHTISDSSDDLKRQRGRRGLDMLNDLKKAAKIRIFKDSKGTLGEVDKELVRLAKKYKMVVMTLDYNLNKVAKVGSVKVLNVNELANAVKSSVLPGEKIKVKIVQEGKERGQGVGYFDDGTMVVVEGASKSIGRVRVAVVARVIQTDAGKMVFCEK